jgi:hypothetical protein
VFENLWTISPQKLCFVMLWFEFFMYMHPFTLKWPLSVSSKIESVLICVLSVPEDYTRKPHVEMVPIYFQIMYFQPVVFFH